MSQKTEKPVLSGQRIKTRKRDEKEKLDVNGFRDQLLQGLIEAGTELEAVTKFLDGAGGTKLDYRRYGETLFDVLIAGGIIGPNGVVPAEGGKLAPCCVFASENSIEALRAYEQVFHKLMRRFKYLEKMFEEQIKKVFTYMKRYTDEERSKLATMTGLWISNQALPPTCLQVVAAEHLVKDNVALEFLLGVLSTWKQEKGVSGIASSFKKSGLESKLMDFFPSNKRTPEYFNSVFQERGLAEIVRLQKNQASQEIKNNLQKIVADSLDENKNAKEITAEVKEYSQKNNLSESDIVTILWASLMSAVEWNKKEELVGEQALKHLKNYASLLGAFCSTPKSELTLILRIQEYCYDNMNFMKVFQKIIILLYKSDVLSEDSIMKWYKDGHSAKGRSVFLEQMKKFIDWLQNAEEESDSEED
jgi:hypothetical protein